jgi:hypothetical protein
MPAQFEDATELLSEDDLAEIARYCRGSASWPRRALTYPTGEAILSRRLTGSDADSAE